MAASRALHSPAEVSIEILKWKVKKGSRVEPGAVLMTYKIVGSEEVRKLKSQEVGTVTELSKKEGDKVSPRQQLLTLGTGCSHNVVIKDLCAECGKDLREERLEERRVEFDSFSQPKEAKKKLGQASVSMIHSVPELVVTDKHAEEIGQKDLLRLKKSKKLVLLVDLDQTLIHTTTELVPKKLKDVHHFQMGGVWYHTKFRPGTTEFLQTISKYYELHIVTFGVRLYAHTIARMMDKQEKYFSHRILSRDELLDPNTKKANLRSLFPCGDDMVAIIDDREDVWNYSLNVVPVLPYKFFTGTGDINSPPNAPVRPTGQQPAKPSCQLASANEKLPSPSDMYTDESKLLQSTDSLQSEAKSSQEKQDSNAAADSEADSDIVELVDLTDKSKTSNDSATSNEDTSTQDDQVLSKEKPASGSESEEKTEAGVGSKEPEAMGDILVKFKSDASNKDGETVPSKAPEIQKDEDKEVEWPDEDNYLEALTHILIDVHNEFYREESAGQQKKRKIDEPKLSVASVVTSLRKEVLRDCVLAFSGLFPQSIPMHQSTPYIIATQLGAKVVTDMDDTVTHLVASRLGTKKVRQAAANVSCTIVHPDWLWLTWYHFKRQNELKHILSLSNEIPEPKRGPNFITMCGSCLKVALHSWRHHPQIEMAISCVLTMLAQEYLKVQYQCLFSCTCSFCRKVLF